MISWLQRETQPDFSCDSFKWLSPFYAVREDLLSTVVDTYQQDWLQPPAEARAGKIEIRYKIIGSPD